MRFAVADVPVNVKYIRNGDCRLLSGGGGQQRRRSLSKSGGGGAQVLIKGSFVVFTVKIAICDNASVFVFCSLHSEDCDL